MARRLLIGLAVAVGTLGGAGGAQAYMAYTGDAQPGVASATVYGYVDTNNGETDWAFAYGASRRYGHWSTVGTIPAGRGTVMVAAELSGLAPRATYHYRLVAVPVYHSQPEWAWASSGTDRRLHTRAERLELVDPTLFIRGSTGRVTLQCTSTRPCRGAMALDLRARRSRCSRFTVSLPAGSSRSLAFSLAAVCQQRLKAARDRRLAATLAARLSGGLPRLRAPVTLQAG